MGFLTNKTAIITGAGRAVLSDGRCGSIGYGIATAYAKEGANLVITGRNTQKLDAAKEELERLYGIRVLTVQADVNAGADNAAVVENVVQQAVDTFGDIHVLINNAQASASGVTLADHTTEQFDLAVYSGLYATFHYMKACYPYLKKTQGSVINFASGAGLFGNFGQCAYAAAKEGIRGLTRVACYRMGQRSHQCQHRLARWHGLHSWKTSRMPIRTHSKRMSRCRRQDIWAMQNWRSVGSAFSWLLRISSS